MLQQAIGDAWGAITSYAEELFLAFGALQVGTSLAASTGVSLVSTVVQPFFLAGAFVVIYRALNDKETSRGQYIDAGKERYVAVLLVLLLVVIGVGTALLVLIGVAAAIAVFRAASILPSEIPQDVTQQEALMLLTDVLSDPVVLLVTIVVLALLIVVLAVFEFATVAAVIDKKEAGDAIRESYRIFKEQPTQILGYTLFKQALALVSVSLPSLVVPALVLENGMITATLFTEPSFLLLGSIIVIPTSMFVNTIHVAYYQRVK